MDIFKILFVVVNIVNLIKFGIIFYIIVRVYFISGYVCGIVLIGLIDV